MRDKIKAALAKAGVDYADIRLERTSSSLVLYRGRNLENAEASTSVGGIARCLVGGGWGYASFNRLEDLAAQVQEAARIAKAVNARVGGKIELAPAIPIEDEVGIPLYLDPRKVPLATKQKLARKYNDIMLGTSKQIVDTQTRVGDVVTEMTFANSEGTYITQEKADVVLGMMAFAQEDGGQIFRGLESHGWCAGFEAVQAREELAAIAARKALALLKAKPARGGRFTVIMDPLHAGVFVHEAFGHLCEADNLAKMPRLKEILKPGRRFGSDFLNIIEGGNFPSMRGNTTYDDEGTPRRSVYLIRNGILEGFMHNRETAALMGAQPTGNARALNYHFQPIVRMRHTYIDRGTATFEEMLKGIDYGVYACGSFGGETDVEQFTFSATYGYEIVNGKLGDMLRDVSLSGNVFETLAHIEMIGDDLEIHGSAGGCGRGGQMPLPLTDGAPHIRVRDVVVGGKA